MECKIIIAPSLPNKYKNIMSQMSPNYYYPGMNMPHN